MGEISDRVEIIFMPSGLSSSGTDVFSHCFAFFKVEAICGESFSIISFDASSPRLQASANCTENSLYDCGFEYSAASVSVWLFSAGLCKCPSLLFGLLLQSVRLYSYLIKILEM